MRDRIEAAVFSACILLFIAATLWASTAGATTWHRTGASVFGPICDPGETVQGYRGDHLPSHPWAFAELGMGTALGGLPYRARLRIQDPVSHRSMTVRRLDIGLGGGLVAGLRRSIDIYDWALRRLLRGRFSCSWTGVVKYRLLK